MGDTLIVAGAGVAETAFLVCVAIVVFLLFKGDKKHEG